MLGGLAEIGQGGVHRHVAGKIAYQASCMGIASEVASETSCDDETCAAAFDLARAELARVALETGASGEGCTPSSPLGWGVGGGAVPFSCLSMGSFDMPALGVAPTCTDRLDESEFPLYSTIYRLLTAG